MLQKRGYLIFELLAIDAGTAPAGTSWIASLEHEIRDDAVENYAVVVTTFGKGLEVFAGL